VPELLDHTGDAGELGLRRREALCGHAEAVRDSGEVPAVQRQQRRLRSGEGTAQGAQGGLKGDPGLPVAVGVEQWRRRGGSMGTG
jgi:hypothetical protein